MNKKKLPKAIRPTAAAAAPEAAASMETADTPESRRASAVKLVERFSLWSGAAGLIPVPVFDLAVGTGIQIRMLARIAKIYNVPFSVNVGKSLIASLAGSMIQVSSAMGAASIMKGVPVVGSVVGAFAMPAMSAGATYAIGMVFIEHFASGGTLLDFHAPDYREFVKSQKARWSSRH